MEVSQSNLDEAVKEDQPSQSKELEELFIQREKQYEAIYLKQVESQQLLYQQKLKEQQLFQQTIPNNILRNCLPYTEFGGNYSSLLVPIRVDLEQDGLKIRDCFTLPYDCELDSVVKILISDYQIRSTPSFISTLKSIINDQIQEFKNISIQLDKLIKIKLNITVDTKTLVDQFDWQLSDNNSPEEFAAIYIQDMNLEPEFATAIAHSIREQIYAAKKLYLMNPMDDLLFLQVTDVVRDPKQVIENSPYLQITSKEELEKIEKDMDRESRRKRRSTQRSRRVVLPEEAGSKDEFKTNRTPLPVPVKFEPSLPVITYNCLHCNTVMKEPRVVLFKVDPLCILSVTSLKLWGISRTQLVQPKKCHQHNKSSISYFRSFSSSDTSP